ncbi:MAG: hypothetical protein ACFFDJ_04085 [Candidatus Odinarchaeota archaeon]
MTEHVDLKALERKAYTSYHQDGIVDIFLGLAIVTFSFVLLFLETSFYLVGGTFVVWIASYAGAKRSITVPRIGYVEFKQSRRIRVMLLVLLLLVLNIVIFVIMAFGELTTDFRIFLNQYGLLVVAGVVGGLFVLFGWVTQIYRFYGYGSVAFLAFIITHVFLLHLFFPIFVLGLTITVTGFVLLYWFIRKYPKTEPGEELYDNWDNE